MGNATSQVRGCFVPSAADNGVNAELLEPLDEGLGHSFCYVRPLILDSPAITPSTSERYTLDSSLLDSDTPTGSFRTISGASVSANVTTARTANLLPQDSALEPAASFESTASFAAIPLQPVRRGSGPLSGFMSGPLERGFMSGPLDNATDPHTYSAPLAYAHTRPGIRRRLIRSVSRPVKGWVQRVLVRRTKEAAPDAEVLEAEYSSTRNLQWAHGKAGEDRVHVVLSEEQGWLFVGIYDGFTGPDATDFLMSNLYKAIDKELEGLLWDYDERPRDASPPSGHLDNAVGEVVREGCGVTRLDCDDELLEKECGEDCLEDQCEGAVPSNSIESIGANHEAKEPMYQLSSTTEISENLCHTSTTIAGHTDRENESSKTTAKRSRKSNSLSELLRMERMEDTCTKESQLVAECSSQSSVDMQPSSAESLRNIECFPSARLSFSSSTGQGGSDCVDGTCPTRETTGVPGEESADSSRKDVPSFSQSGHKQTMKASSMGSKLRKMYRKQKSLRRKLFPWNYDWHRDKPHTDDTTVNPSTVIRKCKSGPVDHDAVLKAMSRALETTEEAYMEMVEKAIDTNPELALMGSCVLVVLMKDQDVYVMNLGDSRFILAQDRLNDCHGNSILTKDDAKHRIRSRESLVRVELDRISEESPVHNMKSGVFKVNKNREISLCRLKMRAVQLSSDHSTSIEEEVRRIKTEHADDSQALMNGRVKGQLQVTRAFGAGFLKKPKFNEALLEMFRVEYIGSSPYISSIPHVLHHRLCSSDRFLVMSSDGLYQYFSNEEVISHAAWFMENVPEGDPAQYLVSELLFRAAKKNGMEFHDLLDIPHGDRRKYHDDVSVMVISLEGRIWRSSG